MKVAVLGATGRTGRHVVAELVRRGHHVSVLVRDPAKPVASGDVRVVVGDCRDESALVDVVTGADAVVSALGPAEKEPTLHRDTAEALVRAMQKAGVRRFVGVSGAGIDVPGDRKSPSAKAISFLIQKLGGAVVADKPAEYRVWAASDRDWTLVRPPRLKDGPGGRPVEHDAHRSVKATWIDRADLAGFLVDVLEQDLHPRRAPFVAAGG